MDETTPQPEPTTPEVPFSTPEEKTEGERKVISFDLLPDEIRADLHKLIGMGYGAIRIRNAMIEKYPNEKRLEVHSATYHAYTNLHRDSIMKEIEAQKEITAASASSLNLMKDVIEDNSLENKRAALMAMYKLCEARMKIMEARQAQGLFDTHAEAVLGNYIKQMREIIEKLVVYQDALNKDSEKQFNNVLETFAHELAVIVFNSYKKLNGDNNFSQFKSEVAEEVKKAVVRLFIEPEKKA